MFNYFCSFFRRLRLRRRRPVGTFVGRRMTHDVAITYRMGAGFAGDINRVHPFSAEPALADPTNPPSFSGQPVIAVAASNGVRALLATDTALTDIYGITVKEYPTQPNSTTLFGSLSTQGFGGSTANPAQALTILRSGYIMVKVSGAVAVAKGGAVHVWIAASSGSHVQGGFEPVASAGNTIPLGSKTTWNGPAGADGIAELAFNI
jgi:hypothetical protein